MIDVGGVIAGGGMILYREKQRGTVSHLALGPHVQIYDGEVRDLVRPDARPADAWTLLERQ